MVRELERNAARFGMLNRGAVRRIESPDVQADKSDDARD